MSVGRRRAKAARNAAAFPRLSASILRDSDWISSGRIACSYGAHLQRELTDYPLSGRWWTCDRCGAVYAYPPTAGGELQADDRSAGAE